MRLLITGVIIAVAASIAIYLYVSRQYWKTLEQTCAQISQWAEAQQLAVGTHVDIKVPEPIVIPARGSVTVVKTEQGDVYVLLKTHIGYKQNFEGVLYSTRPITESDISLDSYGRPSIGTPESVALYYLVVEERINDHFLRVYLDLG